MDCHLTIRHIPCCSFVWEATLKSILWCSAFFVGRRIDALVVLEKTLESPLECKEIEPVNPKGNQPWIFTGKIDAEAEAPMLWPPDAKYWLIGKNPDAGRDWEWKENKATEDEIVGWHHQLNGHELSKLQDTVKAREAWCAAVHEVTKSWTWLGDWTTRTTLKSVIIHKSEIAIFPFIFQTKFVRKNP